MSLPTVFSNKLCTERLFLFTYRNWNASVRCELCAGTAMECHIKFCSSIVTFINSVESLRIVLILLIWPSGPVRFLTIKCHTWGDIKRRMGICATALYFCLSIIRIQYKILCNIKNYVNGVRIGQRGVRHAPHLCVL